MPELSRPQLVVYAAAAVAVLLLGTRWIRTSEVHPEPSPPAPSGIEGGPRVRADPAGLRVDLSSGQLLVHVAGEVRKPGVHRLPAGSRVADAIDRAGGPTGDAELDAINLAARLADGQQVVVPGRVALGASAVGGGAGAADGPISLGSATAEQLESIEGIGPVTAAAIVAFRDERGGLGSVEDLHEVRGIGPATMETLRARLQP